MAPKKRTNETKEDTAKEEPPAKVQKGEHDKDEKAVKDESAGVKVLEKGHIFFLYRPKVNPEVHLRIRRSFSTTSFLLCEG